MTSGPSDSSSRFETEVKMALKSTSSHAAEANSKSGAAKMKRKKTRTQKEVQQQNLPESAGEMSGVEEDSGVSLIIESPSNKLNKEKIIHKKTTAEKGQRKVSSNSIVDRQHESFCRICARGGPFIRCQTCPAVFHKTCLYYPALQLTAEGTWRCTNCLYMRGRDALRNRSTIDTKTSKGGTKRKASVQ